jgi:5-methylcytosine-specific restriction endonuclease McrA
MFAAATVGYTPSFLLSDGPSASRQVNCRRGPRDRHYSRRARQRTKRCAEELYDTRERLFAAQGGLCAICGQPLDPVIHRATTDHVIPLALGGRDALGNFVAVHRRCNTWKANDIPTGCEMVWLLFVNAKVGASPTLFWRPAQAIEVAKPSRREAGSTEGESAVPQGCAPPPASKDQP